MTICGQAMDSRISEHWEELLTPWNKELTAKKSERYLRLGGHNTSLQMVQQNPAQSSPKYKKKPNPMSKLQILW